MRTYTVRPGDSPAQIAIDHAGCPKCARDLIAANPHKEIVRHPNGYITFKELRPDERLNLPAKWFSKEFDELPRAYFAALPHPDGVTSSTLGDAASGVLGDYATLETASAHVGALSAMGDQQFSGAVDDAATLLYSAVREAVSGTNATAKTYAESVLYGTGEARQRNSDLLIPAILSGDSSAAYQARVEILGSLSTALGDAKLALNAFYSDLTPAPSTSGFSTTLTSAAQAAVAALKADANYCASVARVGSAVNSAVHGFKSAWNASQSPAVPINTGNYEQPTAEALARVVQGAPAACGTRAAPTPSPAPVPSLLVTAPKKTELSTAEVAGLGVLAAGAVGGAVYLATKKPVRRRRR